MAAFRCKIKFNAADDDFVPSTLVFTATRFCLFCWILCVNAYIFVTLGRSTGCPDGANCCQPQPLWVLALYLFGELLMEFSVMTVSFLIFVVSASGTLWERFSDSRTTEQKRIEKSGNGAELDPTEMNNSRVRKLRVLMCIRVVLFLPELCFSVFGLVVAFHPQLANQPACASSHIFQLLAAYSIVTTVVTVLKMVFYLVVVDPAGCYSPRPVDYIEEDEASYQRVTAGGRRTTQQTLYNNHTAHHWQKRISLLACGRVSGAQNGNASILEVAKLFSAIFQFPDYTVSDIATAIVLLHNEQKKSYRKTNLQECFMLRQLRKKLIDQLNENEFCDGKAQYKYQPPVPVNLSDPAEFAEVKDAVYFYRYAMAVYGWPLYVFGNPATGCCKLCCKSLTRCCILGKCCQCSDIAFKLMTDMSLTEDNIVHCSEENELFCSPYTVVLDHAKKAVVVAIRGTLSVEDAITSLSVSLTPIWLHEPPYDTLDTQVHQGWLKTAKKILEKLTLCPKFFQLFNDYSDYRLVVVGHSLGGAVAAILSVLIKQEHKELAPRLKSFGYSTPGCVFSYPIAKYCHDFVTTVVLDNDILPRLNWRSLLLLRAALKKALETCNKPKHQVLYTDPLCATCRGEEEEGTDSTLTTEESNFSSFVDFVYNDPDWKCLGHFCVQPLQWSFPSAACVTEFAVKLEESPLDKLPNGARKQIFEDCNPRAFLPGKVLQIDTGKERMCPWLPWPKSTGCQLKWVANEDYCLVHLHRGPLSSHLPSNVYSALFMVRRQHLQGGFERVFTEISPNFTFGRGNDLKSNEDDKDDFWQWDATASGTDLKEFDTIVVKDEDTV